MRGRAAVVPVVLLTAFLAGTPAAFGQEGRGTIVPNAEAPGAVAARKWAVVVGVDNYDDPALPALRYCVADAELISKRLVERCGYEEDRVLVITDSQAKSHLRPLKRNLQRQVQDWLKRAGPKDTVLVFFAGHGFLDARGQGFLATQDCERENLGLTALRTDDLRDMLRQCKAAQKVLVLDCCHAGGDRGVGDAKASSEELGASFRAARGLVTLASCRKDETSREWPAKGQGLFTYFLAEGLSGKADADRNGLVDSDELYHYCLDQVSLIGQKELNVRQTPVRIIGEDVVGRFVLARVGRDLTVTVVPLGEPVEHPAPVHTVALNPDGELGLSASPGSAVLWEAKSGRIKPRVVVQNPYMGTYGAAVSPDVRLLIMTGPATDQGSAGLWDLPLGVQILAPLEKSIGKAEFSPDGRMFLTAFGNNVRLWNSANRREIGPQLLHAFHVSCGAFSPDGRHVLTGSWGIDDTQIYGDEVPRKVGLVRLWSVATGKSIGKPLKTPSPVSDVGIGKDGRFFAVTFNGNVQLGRLGDNGPAGVPLGGGHNCAAFSPDGKWLVTGEDGGATFWDVNHPRQAGMRLPHKGQVKAVAFSPDGAMILTGSGTETAGVAQLWDARTGQAVGSAMAHKGAVACVAFSGDGRRVMTGSSDKTARLWEVRREE